MSAIALGLGRRTSRICAEGRSTACRCPTSGSTRSASSAAARGASPSAAIGRDAGGWRRVLGVDVAESSYTTRGSPSCGLSARAGRRARGLSPQTPTRDSFERSARPSGVPRGSAAPSTSCATACAGRAPGSSGAAWAGSSRRCSAGATPPP